MQNPKKADMHCISTLSGNWQRQLKEYLRPWKLVTLAIGLTLLIAGSFYYQAPDWDIPICFIMAFFAYLSAAWSLRVVVERQWKNFPLMALYSWFTVDGCYWLYWHFKNPLALQLMREANFLASLSLYVMCGLVWYFEGSLKDFLVACKNYRQHIRLDKYDSKV